MTEPVDRAAVVNAKIAELRRLTALHGHQAARVLMLTGLSYERLMELGGFPDE